MICYTFVIKGMADFLFAVRQKGAYMLTRMLIQDFPPGPTPKEGDLYKEITIAGKTYRLLYGYYESFEREGPFNEPIPIYPDLIKEPHYTQEGKPVATAMQNICEHYNGKYDEDSSCADCSFFQSCEDLFGLCNCPQNKEKRNEQRKVTYAETVQL